MRLLRVGLSWVGNAAWHIWVYISWSLIGIFIHIGLGLWALDKEREGDWAIYTVYLRVCEVCISLIVPDRLFLYHSMFE